MLHIFKETKTPPIPRKNITALYSEIFPNGEHINIIFINDRFSRKLNREYRKKETPANVLSFPASANTADTDAPDSGAEIYINAEMAVRDAKKIGVSFRHRVLFLCIHGMLHLLGYEHGGKMELLENIYATKYM